MKLFRINHVLQANQQIVVKVIKNGSVSHSLKYLEVGKTYALDDIDEKSLRERTTQVRYTKESEAYLKDEGVEYEITTCKTCGGKKKHLVLPTVEIFESDEWELK